MAATQAGDHILVTPTGIGDWTSTIRQGLTRLGHLREPQGRHPTIRALS